MRFGDPECQVVVPRLDDRPRRAAGRGRRRRLRERADVRRRRWSRWCSPREGYPATPRTGDVIDGLDAAAASPASSVFCAGVAADESGGSSPPAAACSTSAATGPTIAAARDGRLRGGRPDLVAGHAAPHATSPQASDAMTPATGTSRQPAWSSTGLVVAELDATVERTLGHQHRWDLREVAAAPALGPRHLLLRLARAGPRSGGPRRRRAHIRCTWRGGTGRTGRRGTPRRTRRRSRHRSRRRSCCCAWRTVHLDTTPSASSLRTPPCSTMIGRRATGTC